MKKKIDFKKLDEISYKDIQKAFEKVKSLDFIQSNRPNNTGIGKTFEDYLGVKENNSKNPDYGVFEVKSQRVLSSSYVTFFTKEPGESPNTIHDLRLQFGKPDNKYKKVKVLHTSMFANRYNTCNSKYCFIIENNKVKKRLNIIVKDISKKKTLNNKVYFTYSEIEDSLKKLENLFFVRASKELRNNIEHFHFRKATVFIKFKLKKFYELLNNGDVMFDIRFGVYKSGKNAGKLHNHGCGFRVKKEHFEKLYERNYSLD